MSIDLWMVLASVGLCWTLLILAAAPGLLVPGGIVKSAGNRGDPDEAPTAGWLARTNRALRNLQENLILFVAIVLVVHVAGEADSMSALGAEVFFGARVAHAVLYIGGVPGLRSIAWVVSLVGMGLVVAALF